MEIKWNKAAISELMGAINFIEENEFYSYAVEVERNILSKIRSLSKNPLQYPLDKYKRQNKGNYRAFEINSYRISYRVQKDGIRILRVRHTSRRIRKY